MKNLYCNQIKIFINLEIIGQKDKDKKKYIYFLILGFVDNILNRHNYYSCKSNTTFFHYLTCHTYPKKCIYLFLKSKNLLKFLLFGEVTWCNHGV